MRTVPFFLLLLCALAFTLNGQGQIRCDIKANLLDRDPKGTNVRSGAGTTFAVIGTLPAEETDAVTVIASKPSWVKISGADDEDGKRIFSKQGWVFASLLGMSISWNPDDKLKKGDHNLYSEPNKKGRVLGRLPAESQVRLVGCDGKWAKVSSGQKTGWIAPEAQCTDTRTTCS